MKYLIKLNLSIQLYTESYEYSIGLGTEMFLFRILAGDALPNK